MRTALISDIHGNFDGFMAVLDDIAKWGCDRVLCLGDLVDGGPKSIEVVRYFRDNYLLCVQGNHDEYPNTDLPGDVTSYLCALPKAIVEGEILYTHTSPRHKQNKITDNIEAWNAFEESEYRRVFVGDVHIPLIFGHKSEEKATAREYEIPYDCEFEMESDDRYIACVGALGYSRDGYHLLRYAIYDSNRDTLMFRAPTGPIMVF